MSWCPKCGAEYREGFTECATCGATLQAEKPILSRFSKRLCSDVEADEAEKTHNFWTSEVNPRAAFLWIMLILSCLAGWGLGTYHVVQSSKGTQLVRKVHFTFAECFVSLDAITNMPAVASSAKYPLTVKALQREGILESDEDREQRIQREVQEQMDKSWQDVQRHMSGQ